MTNSTAGHALLWCLPALVAGCEGHRIVPLEAPPPLHPLEYLSTITGSESFGASGAAGLDDCGVILVGSTWGTILRIRPDWTLDPATGRIPGARRAVGLGVPVENELLAWTRDIEWLGVVDTRDLSSADLPIPEHPWHEKRAGPAAQMGHGRFALSSIGDGYKRWPKPDPWESAPLVQVFHPDSGVVQALGEVEKRDGRYLSWWSSQLRLGMNGEILQVLMLAEARLMEYAPTGASDSLALRTETQLPRYFSRPAPREEVVTLPWIDGLHGEQPIIFDVPHATAAAFGPAGKVYVVRNYMAEWTRFQQPRYATQGNWTVTARGLEVYDRTGRILGAYSMPEGRDVTWLTVDERGRLFLPIGDGSILVARDPTYSGLSCPEVPAALPLHIPDQAPSPDSIATHPWN